MYKEFHKKPTIHDPDEFEALCTRAGANTIFNSILSPMTDERHDQRVKHSRRTMSPPSSLMIKLRLSSSKVSHGKPLARTLNASNAQERFPD